MDIVSDEQRDNAYANATAAQKFLYSSPESGALLYDLAQRHGLQESNNYRKFAIIVGDAVLGLVKTGDLPEAMQTQLTLNETAAKTLVVDLLDYLSMSPDAQTQPRAIPTVQTGASEPVYTSTQSAILREGASPAPAAPNEPRWDTAR